MKRKPLYPRCVATAADGKQCGHRSKDGSNPPICHVHKALAAGTSGLSHFEPTLSEIELLQRLTRDKNPQVRLRAIDLLLEEKRRGESCPTCASRRAANPDLDLNDLTDAQRLELAEALATIRRIKRTQNPDLPLSAAERMVDEARNPPPPSYVASAPAVDRVAGNGPAAVIDDRPLVRFFDENGKEY